MLGLILSFIAISPLTPPPSIAPAPPEDDDAAALAAASAAADAAAEAEAASAAAAAAAAAAKIAVLVFVGSSILFTFPDSTPTTDPVTLPGSSVFKFLFGAGSPPPQI